MNTPQVDLLFPIPVLRNELDRNFTQAELDFINKYSKKDMTHENDGNVTSNNNYILNEPELKSLRDFCLTQVKTYINYIINPKDKVEPFITQSWLNFTEKGGYHPRHNHPNSYLSGVLYINSDVTKDKIIFYSSIYRQIGVVSAEFNIMNSDSWGFYVKPGLIFLFPSSLDHKVEKVISDSTRISLAFNTFISGNFGDNKTLTELIIAQQ